ncbi:hypothetical protein [Psychrobacter sp. H7-1]|uniref:hypothetical protein n=1 Tax=Psychrobacter sp. H7-1 TaxID=1569265 RepID=UPI00191B84AA|nr:hypothetical protein [Psychrobacter sp. H7-1]
MNIHKTNHKPNSLLKASLLFFGSLAAQQALAAPCPTIYKTTEAGLLKVNSTNTNPGAIYFCKQTDNFTPASFIFAPTQEQLVTGGSQVIKKGNTIQTFPLSNSVSLSGFTLNDLNLNQLTAAFPNSNGQYSSPSLFNFYSQVTSLSLCTTQITTIKTYLRSNANIFKTIGIVQSAVTDNSSPDSIAKINNAILTNPNGGTIKADISFMHVNNKTGQYFSDPNSNNVMCWLGVGAQIILKPDSALTRSGNYTVNVGVQTQ